MVVQAPSRPSLGSEFQIWWAGQAISDIGTAFTQYGLPLLVFKLTGSPTELALTTAAVFMPYLLFGLVVGAWADRSDRKKLMLRTSLIRAAVLLFIPALSAGGILNVNWLYAIAFLNSTLGVFYSAAVTAAVPGLVEKDQLVEANGRVTAARSAASIGGPLLAGLLITIAPFETVFLVDSFSFLISAFSLALVKRSFNQPAQHPARRTTIRQDIAEGMRYLWRQSLLFSVTLFATMINFWTASVAAQQVLLVKRVYRADDNEVSLFYSAAGLGAVVFSLLVRRLPKSWPLGRIVLGTMLLFGLLTIGMGLTTLLWVGLALRVLAAGCIVIFNVQVSTLSQSLIPNELLGRVMTTGTVLSWAVIPVGSVLGGVFVEATANIALLYQVIGFLLVLTCLAFLFLTPLGREPKIT